VWHEPDNLARKYTHHGSDAENNSLQWLRTRDSVRKTMFIKDYFVVPGVDTYIKERKIVVYDL
jgi:hypothetical protein